MLKRKRITEWPLLRPDLNPASEISNASLKTNCQTQVFLLDSRCRWYATKMRTANREMEMSVRVSAQWEIYGDCNSTHASLCSVIKYNVNDDTVKTRGNTIRVLKYKVRDRTHHFCNGSRIYGVIFFSSLCYPTFLQTLEIHWCPQVRPKTLSRFKWMLQKTKLLDAVVELYHISEWTKQTIRYMEFCCLIRCTEALNSYYKR
jgi:hypothetical protein